MPHADYHFDDVQDCKNPGQAIAYLQNPMARTTLANFYGRAAIPQIPDRIALGSTALLMMGTTDDLQKALRQDYQDGIKSLETTGAGSMTIWYVRRRAGRETKTVVIIASWPDYWGSRKDYYYDAQNNPKGWYNLHPNSYINAISLQTLADHILPAAKGVDAWW
jgi:hypothetical protein